MESHLPPLYQSALRAIDVSSNALRTAGQYYSQISATKKRSTLTCDTFCANRSEATWRVSDFEVDVLWDYGFETLVISFICHFHCLLSSGSDY